MTHPPSINYQALTFWFSIINFLIMSGIGVVVWWTNRDKITDKRFRAAENRIVQLESDVKHPPACTYHGQLELRIDSMRADMDEKIKAVHGDTREIKGTVKGINRAVDLMNEFLINQGGKK